MSTRLIHNSNIFTVSNVLSVVNIFLINSKEYNSGTNVDSEKEAMVNFIKKLDDGIGIADFAILGNMPFLG